jgi:hypothetical protein
MDANIDQTGRNPQTGSPYLVLELSDCSFFYIEWHRNYIIFANETEDEDHCAQGCPVGPGSCVETTGHSCIDDALNALEDEYTSVLDDWHSPPNLGI